MWWNGLPCDFPWPVILLCYWSMLGIAGSRYPLPGFLCLYQPTAWIFPEMGCKPCRCLQTGIWWSASASCLTQMCFKLCWALVLTGKLRWWQHCRRSAKRSLSPSNTSWKTSSSSWKEGATMSMMWRIPSFGREWNTASWQTWLVNRHSESETWILAFSNDAMLLFITTVPCRWWSGTNQSPCGSAARMKRSKNACSISESVCWEGPTTATETCAGRKRPCCQEINCSGAKPPEERSCSVFF